MLRSLLHPLPLLAAGVLSACAMPPPSAPTPPVMSFFVTSVSPGRGGDLGGLEGADAHCQALATAAGAGQLRWRAYLSQASNLKNLQGEPAVHARERIGPGPWHNAQGQLIARTVDELHAPGFTDINRQSALSERGQSIPGRLHDILTGSRPDGTAPSPLDADMSCRGWRSSADMAEDGSSHGALVGHHDRVSAIAEPWASSWNSAHRSRGCSPARLAELGSGGLFYCFALPPAPR